MTITEGNDSVGSVSAFFFDVLQVLFFLLLLLLLPLQVLLVLRLHAGLTEGSQHLPRNAPALGQMDLAKIPHSVSCFCIRLDSDLTSDDRFGISLDTERSSKVCGMQ